MDQAEELRRRIQEKAFASPLILGCLRAKGGVGASTLLANLSALYAKMGKKVLFLDASRKLLTPPVLGQTEITARIESPVDVQNLHLDPSRMGFSLAYLENPENLGDSEWLQNLKAPFDILVVDTPAFPYQESRLQPFSKGLPCLLLTPQPACLFETYAMIKAMAEPVPERPWNVIVNFVRDAEDGKAVYLRFKDLLESRFGISLKLLGAIPFSWEIPLAERAGSLFVSKYPENPLTGELERMALGLVGLSPKVERD